MEKLGSDATEMKQKVANLRKQCNEYDLLLKHLSMPYMDLPPNMQKDLDEHGRFKRKLGLYSMDMLILNEFNCIKTEENIGKKIAILRAHACNEKIEKELAKTIRNLEVAKSFNDSMNNNIKQNENIDQSMRDAHREIVSFTEKKNKLDENIKVDLDPILMKLEQLVP